MKHTNTSVVLKMGLQQKCLQAVITIGANMGENYSLLYIPRKLSVLFMR